MTLFVIVWILCGILAYGIFKNCDRLEYTEQSQSRREHGYYYGLGYEIDNLFAIFFGPAILLGGLYFSYSVYGEIGICFRMPREFCKHE